MNGVRCHAESTFDRQLRRLETSTKRCDRTDGSAWPNHVLKEAAQRKPRRQRKSSRQAVSRRQHGTVLSNETTAAAFGPNRKACSANPAAELLNAFGSPTGGGESMASMQANFLTALPSRAQLRHASPKNVSGDRHTEHPSGASNDVDIEYEIEQRLPALLFRSNIPPVPSYAWTLFTDLDQTLRRSENKLPRAWSDPLNSIARRTLRSNSNASSTSLGPHWRRPFVSAPLPPFVLAYSYSSAVESTFVLSL